MSKRLFHVQIENKESKKTSKEDNEILNLMNDESNIGPGTYNTNPDTFKAKPCKAKAVFVS